MKELAFKRYVNGLEEYHCMMKAFSSVLQYYGYDGMNPIILSGFCQSFKGNYYCFDPQVFNLDHKEVEDKDWYFFAQYFRIRFGLEIEKIFNNIDIQCEYLAEEDDDEAWEKTMEWIDQDLPPIIKTNTYYIPYSPDYQTEPGGILRSSHSLVACGYDKNRIKIYDPTTNNYLGWIDYDHMRKARNYAENIEDYERNSYYILHRKDSYNDIFSMTCKHLGYLFKDKPLLRERRIIKMVNRNVEVHYMEGSNRDILNQLIDDVYQFGQSYPDAVVRVLLSWLHHHALFLRYTRKHLFDLVKALWGDFNCTYFESLFDQFANIEKSWDKCSLKILVTSQRSNIQKYIPNTKEFFNAIFDLEDNMIYDLQKIMIEQDLLGE